MSIKRVWVCLIAGAILGVVCIIGAQLRSGFEKDAPFLFAFWYNRLLMGLIIGLVGTRLRLWQAIGRGAVLGLVVSFAFFASTGFGDLVGFLVGVIYGIIIEIVALKFT